MRCRPTVTPFTDPSLPNRDLLPLIYCYRPEAEGVAGPLDAPYEPIGIMAALDGVVELLLHYTVVQEAVILDRLTFYRGLINNRQVVLVRCGVGKVNAALCAAILIKQFSARSVILVGMAGALFSRLKRGDIVVSEDLIQHDLDATRLGHPPGVLPGLGIRAIAADESMILLALKCSSALLGVKAYRGRVLTGDQFISSKISFLRTLFNGLCVEMEGGAVAQVCALTGIPFVVIRAISQRSNGKFMRKYNTFSQMVAGNLALLLREMLNNTTNIPSA